MGKLNNAGDRSFARTIHQKAFPSVTDTERILKAVETLPKDEQLLLECRFCYGMTVKEVGEQLGMSGVDVSKKLERVFRKLRHPALRLENYGGISSYAHKKCVNELEKTRCELDEAKVEVRQLQEAIHTLLTFGNDDVDDSELGWCD